MWRNKKGSFWGFWALKCIRHFENTYPKVPIHLFWLAYISFSLLSFEIVVKQAWFHFFGDVTRNCYFMWKPGFFMFFSIQNVFLATIPWVNARKFVFSSKCFKFLLFEKCDVTRLLFCHFSQYEPFKALFVIENSSTQCSKQ